MPLDTDVIPAVLSMLRGLTQTDGVTPLFKVVSEGPTASIPQSPAVWVQGASFDQPEWMGSDRETTDWQVEVTLLWEWAADQWNAEHSLAALVEPVRQGCRSHIKLGRPNIERALVRHGDWAYLSINGITYRAVNLRLDVREKFPVTYSA